MTTKTKFILYAAVLVLSTAFFITTCDKNDNTELETLRKENTEIKTKLDKYRVYSDSVTQLIIIYEDSIIQLNHVKPVIRKVYEAKIKSFRNPDVVDDDSIVLFLSEKIYRKQ